MVNVELFIVQIFLELIPEFYIIVATKNYISEMKIILLFLFVISSVAFSATADTTVKIDLNFDGKEETVKLLHKGEDQEFTLRINNAEYKGQFEYAYGADIEILDINRNDGLREVMVKGYGPSDQNDMHFFQFIDGKIIAAGRLPSNFGIEAKGNGGLTEYGWMGFWTIKLKYDFDSKAKTITLVPEEFYDVMQECEVKESFKLLTRREDDAPVVIEVKPKAKLTIIKADITPKCKTADGYDDDFFCDWYLIRTADGKEGWARLRDFYEKVDGLVWAG